jgi:hypothetical protein
MKTTECHQAQFVTFDKEQMEEMIGMLAEKIETKKKRIDFVSDTYLLLNFPFSSTSLSPSTSLRLMLLILVFKLPMKRSRRGRHSLIPLMLLSRPREMSFRESKRRSTLSSSRS